MASPADSSAAVPPLLGIASPGGASEPPSGALTPQQIGDAYGINLLSQDGAGQTIAIVDAYDDPDLVSSSNATAYATSDLHNFNVYYGLPDFGTTGGPTFTKLDQSGGTNYPGTDTTGNWESEEALDVEWAHAFAPMANIVLVEANSNIFASGLFKAANTARKLAGVSVVSMSFYGGENSLDTAYDSVYFQTPSGHQGVTFVACSGDYGSPGGYPAYSTSVLAVGGTSLTLNGNTYGGETGWSGSGGGISQFDGQPSYQQGLTVYNGNSTIDPQGMRTIPDVAFDADPNTGVAIYDSYNGGSSPWFQYGGTSLASPCWAGLIALADQMRVTAGLGTLDGPSQTLPRLYQLSAADFHDITSGTSTGNPNYSVDFTPTTGSSYNLVTGLGSPKANLLVPDLALGSPHPDLTLTATHVGNFRQEDVGDTYTITVSNSGSGATSGTVSLVDTLPGGLTATDMSGPGWTVNLATLTATRSDAIAPGISYPALTVTVNVAATAPASVTNTATVSGGGEVVTLNDTASDPTTINSAVAISPATLPIGTVNVAYNQTITASGGTGSITLVVSNTQNAIAGLVVPPSGSNTLSITVAPTAAGTESFTVTATDTLGATTSANYSITVTCNPPILTGIESSALTYTEGIPATAVSSSLAVNDAESATLIGATVWISGNYQNGEDILSFANTANITGSWSAATGTLTLSGSETLANYQAALRAVTYANNRLNPSTAMRTVSFKVNDGQADSNVLTRNIAVQLLNPAVDNVVLGGPVASSLVNDYPANTIFSQITFNGNCTLSGNSAVLDSTIVNAQGSNTLSIPLVFGGDAVFQVSAGSLAVERPIDTAGHMLTVDTAYSTTATINGSISGSGGLIKSGGGKLVLSGTGGGLGNVTVQSGTLKVTTANAVADGASLTVGGNSGLFSAIVPAPASQAAAAVGVPAVVTTGAPNARSIIAQRFIAGMKVNGTPDATAVRAKVFENLAENLARRSAASVDWPWRAFDAQGHGRDAAILARDAVLAEYAR